MLLRFNMGLGDAAPLDPAKVVTEGTNKPAPKPKNMEAAALLDHAHESLALLRWNTERFPKSANTWDSLAWAYYFLGDHSHAVENFKEDVRLDPQNRSAAQLLEELTSRLP